MSMEDKARSQMLAIVDVAEYLKLRHSEGVGSDKATQFLAQTKAEYRPIDVWFAFAHIVEMAHEVDPTQVSLPVLMEAVQAATGSAASEALTLAAMEDQLREADPEGGAAGGASVSE